jgi:hypothetical protein
MTGLLAAALVANLLFEALAATALIGGPTGLRGEASAAGRWSMHYGFAVIAIASASIWLWPRRRELAALTPVLGILTTFHAAVATSLIVAREQRAGSVVHAVLALAFLFLFLRRERLALR